MTREEIEKLASDYLNDNESTMDMERLFEFVIQMTEPSKDTISREKVADEFADWFGYDYQNQFFYKRLKDMPSVQSEQKVGKWIEKPSGRYGAWQSWCSVCGSHSGIGGIESNRHKPYCPNCGAKMEEGE